MNTPAELSVRFAAMKAGAHASRLAAVAAGLWFVAACGNGTKATVTSGAPELEKTAVAALVRAPAPEDVVWTRRAPEGPPNPSKRFFHGLSYDPKAKVTVLFGGTSTGDVDGIVGDTWTWNGATWTRLTPAKSPSSRFGFDMVYSTTHQAVVLYGGAGADSAGDYTPLGDTWTWNGVTWTELPRRTTDPPALAGHSLAFDSKRGVVVLYGGLGEADDNLDVWELGTQGWVNRGHAASSPGSLDSFVMTYDDRIGATVVFGGTSPAGITDPAAAVSDTYTWNGTVWNRVTGDGPSARTGSAGAFDTRRGRTVIFGGTDQDGIDSDETWEFAAGEWELREPLRKPTALSNAKFTYDASRDRLVSFGGYTFFPEGETWEYAHFGSACQATTDCDGYPCVDGVCCKVATCGTCERCSEAAGKCEPVRSAEDANGGCSGGKTCNAVGACVSKGGSAGCTVDAECATGHCADGVCCDSACEGSCESCTVASSVGTCTFVTGAAVHGTCRGSGGCRSTCTGDGPECAFPGPDIDCGSSCADAMLIRRFCNGGGACQTDSPSACADHLACLDDLQCRESCASATDCVSGFICRNARCIAPSAECVDEVTASGPGGSEDCRPYRCDNGRCRTDCRDIADCAPGRLCNRDGNCITEPGGVPSPGDPAPGSDAGAAGGKPDQDTGEGCGCRLGARPEPRPSTNELLFVLAALALTGRRRAKPRADR